MIKALDSSFHYLIAGLTIILAAGAGTALSLLMHQLLG